jgi:integrase
MPKLINRAPRLCHERKSNQAVVRINGQKIYLGRYGEPTTKENYKKIIREWADERDNPPALTVNGMLLKYWAHAEKYYRHKDGTPTTEIRLIGDAIRVLKELYGHIVANTFGTRALNAVREKMIADGKHCRKSINDHVGRIKRAFAWACDLQLIDSGVYHGLLAFRPLREGRSVARESIPIRPVPMNVVSATLPHVSRQVMTMIRLQELTAMRPGEVTLMRPCDISVLDKVWAYRPMRHKTEHHGHERVIYLGRKAQKLLKPWLKRDVSAYLFSPAEAEAERNVTRRQGRTSPMTPSQYKRRPKKNPKRPKRDHYTVGAYRKAIDYGIVKANKLIKNTEKKIPHWHPHQLRHNAATRLQREFGTDVARVVLGHRSAAVTQIYIEVDRTKAAAIMAKVG